MHSFYVGAGGEMEREEAKHAFRVLRLRCGEEIEALDGRGGRFLGRIVELDEAQGRVEILEQLSSNESPVRLTVYQGIPKADKMELLAQKLTELGCARFIPVRMERCVAKLDARDAQKRAERLDKIAQEAVKQCGRALPMRVGPAMSFSEALEDMRIRELVLLPWEEARENRLGDAFQKHAHARDIGVVIGPEGGISAIEVQKLRQAGAQVVTLGPRILRTETAAMAAAAVIQALWGDL